MNDNEIVKAWEKVLNNSDEPIGEHWMVFVTTQMAKETFDMLTRQKAEIERLSNFVSEERCREIAKEMFPPVVAKAKSEAYREFAERFNDLLKEYAPYDTFLIYEIKDRIDIVEDELTEKNDLEG